MDITAGQGPQGPQDRQEPISLETPIGDEEDSHLGDFIEDKSAVSPFERAAESNLRARTLRALETLPRREREVIALRLADRRRQADHTLEEVGRAFNVTRERIRQIENHTLKKLQSIPEAQKLRDGA
jgi:RNA polymerase primary sigma factor